MTAVTAALPALSRRAIWNDEPAVVITEPLAAELPLPIFESMDCGCSGILGRLLIWGTRNARPD